MSFTASCHLCGETAEYDTDELAKAAVVEHVYRLHRDAYYAVCCVNGEHGALCNGNHRLSKHHEGCDRKLKARWSGLACDCGAVWDCA